MFVICVKMPPTAGPPRNRLLGRLSADELRNLRPALKTVSLQTKQVLHRQGEQLRFVYFPNGGVVSMATLLSDGAMIQTATIGDDGLVGAEAFFGAAPVAACESLVLMPRPGDSAERMPVADFRHALATLPHFQHAVATYVEALYAVMARLMACHTHHDLAARCARVLLTMHDRLHGQDFRLSHELLAVMLGVRRPSVSVAAEALKKAGLIRYTHGHLTVLDRRRLEAAACECYSVIRVLSAARDQSRLHRG